jgi:long-chain acyl-CoA synthetase
VFVLSPWVAQSFVYGNSLKNNVVAVVVPDEDHARAWCSKKGVTYDYAKLCAENEDFKKELFDDLMTLSASNKLSSLEKPKMIHLTHEPFAIENELLTPTFKLKRNVAGVHFKPQIDALYEKIEAAEKARAI